MNPKDIRTLITEAENTAWFKSVEETISLPHIAFEKKLVGFSAIYAYIFQEKEDWASHEYLPNEFHASKNYFSGLTKQLVNFITNYKTTSNESSLKSHWNNNIAGQIRNPGNQIFIHASKEVKFLFEIYETNKNYFSGAVKFFTGNHDLSLNDRNNFVGALFAYEFYQNGRSGITSLIKSNKEVIDKNKRRFDDYLTQSENQLVSYLKSTKDSFTEYSKAIDDLKSAKEELFTKWFNPTMDGYNDFFKKSNSSIKDLEKTYEEILRLKKPADYWAKRAIKLNEEGWNLLRWMIFLIVITCIPLYFLLWQTPDGMLKSFSLDTSSAIRWSIIFVAFVSLMIYGIRLLHRAAFSSFHLARDAEEREQLTYVYLSLIKESAIKDEERHLIMQSLFSRADTGLLKEDSSPTMPSDFVGKLIGK